ncbi:MAG: right-handed parallel beta-helix repeat-containing protein, partial [Planctomycetes bacterium]|nr:right-handed parallel beta-helix repeat-containing protein [Planctomycetota bacterium]
GDAPCAGQSCDEDASACFDCESDGECDDDIACNGQETCADGACQPGVGQCSDPDPICDTQNDVCVECLDSGDCDPGEYCEPAANTCQPGTPVTGFIRRGDDKPGVNEGTPATGRPITISVLDADGHPLDPPVSDTTSDGGFTLAIPPEAFSDELFNGKITASGTDVEFEADIDIVNLPPTDSLTDQILIAFYDFYVDNNGADTNNNGTENNPLLTPQEVAYRVLPGDTARFNAGVYPDGGIASARMSVSQSGSPTRYITFEGSGDGEATFDGQSSKSWGISFPSADQVGYIILRNLTITAFTARGISGQNAHHMLIENVRCIDNTGPNNGWGLHIFGSDPGISYVTIRNCEFGRNGRSGCMVGNANGPTRSEYVLIEDCIAWDNGEQGPRIQGQGFNFQTDDDLDLDLYPLAHHCTFRNNIGWNNRSSFIETADAAFVTLEGNIGWRYLNETSTDTPPAGYPSFFDSGDGDVYKQGLHENQVGLLVRNNVGFDAWHATFQTTNVSATYYNNTAFDGGHPSDPDGSGWHGCYLQENSDSRHRNNVAIGTQGTMNGRADCRYNSPALADSDYGYYHDGTDFTGTSGGADNDAQTLDSTDGPHGLDIAAARAAAAAWEAGTLTKPELRSAIQEALIPPPSSVLFESGTFLTFTTQSGYDTTLIPVDRDPTLWFRGPSDNSNTGPHDVGLEFPQGDFIQVDGAVPSTARIITMTEDTIEVDQEMSFAEGAGISLPWNGDLPERGAFENEQ